MFSTANEYKYHYLMDYGVDVRGQTSITFEVMACNDAHIALSKDRGVDGRDTYEIVIGGWGDHQSVIRGLSLQHFLLVCCIFSIKITTLYIKICQACNVLYIRV